MALHTISIINLISLTKSIHALLFLPITSISINLRPYCQTHASQNPCSACSQGVRVHWYPSSMISARINTIAITFPIICEAISCFATFNFSLGVTLYFFPRVILYNFFSFWLISNANLQSSMKYAGSSRIVLG